MTIRLAKPDDLTAIVAIYNETIPSRMVTADTEEVTVADKQPWFDSHTAQRPIFVYCENNQVLAWLSYKSFYGRQAYDGTVREWLEVIGISQFHQGIRFLPQSIGVCAQHHSTFQGIHKRMGRQHACVGITVQTFPLVAVSSRNAC